MVRVYSGYGASYICHLLKTLTPSLTASGPTWQGWARDVNGGDRDETEMLAF